MQPEDVGFEASRGVLTARTGRAGPRDRLEKLGYLLSTDELDQIYERFLAVADKKTEVFDEDLTAILHDELHTVKDRIRLDYLHIYSGTSAIPTATVRLTVDGETAQFAAVGDGPVDAVFKAISAATKQTPPLTRLEIRAVTKGTEAIGEATVQLNIAGRKAMGRGASTDIIEASARAYVDALNKLAHREKSTEGLGYSASI